MDDIRADKDLQSEILSQMAEGINVVRSSDSVILFTNPAFERLLGYDAGELIGRHLSEVNASDDADSRERAGAIVRSLASTGSWQGEIRNRKKDGSAIWCAATVSSFDHHRFGKVYLAVQRDITERKNAEESLRKSEERYRALVEATAQVVWVTNIRGEITEFSPSWRTYTGQHLEHETGYAYAEAFHPEDRGMVMERWSEGLEKETPVTLELRVRHRSGAWRWNVVHAVPIRDAAGRVASWVGTCTDIHDRKLAEEAVRSAKEEWERTFDAIVDPVMILDTAFHIVKTNRAMADALGVPAAAAAGMTCYEAIHGTPRPPDQCPYRELLKDGAPHTREIHEPRLGGHTLTTLSPLTDSGGRLRGVIHTTRNINDIKRAEHALFRSEKRLRDMAACLGCGLYVHDEAGQVLFMNPEAERLLGWNEAELAGRNIHEVIHPRRSDGTELSYEDCPLHAVIRTGMRFLTTDEVFVSRDGRTFPVSLISSPLRDAGRIVAVITSFQDISARKALEQERIRAYAALRESELLLQTQFENSPDMIMVLDRDCRFLSLNKAVFGPYAVKDLIGKDALLPLPEHVRAGVRERIDACFRSGTTQIFEHEVGNHGWALARIVPLQTNGVVERVMVISTDVTERKRAEEEREQLVADLQKALSEIKTLHGVLPICAHCKKIRDDNGAWHQLEEYISAHTDSEFTHGICRECAQKIYVEYIGDDIT